MKRSRKKSKRTVRSRPPQEAPPVPRFVERMVVKHCQDPIVKHREAAVRQVDERRRLVDFIASTQEVDRDQEVVITRGIDLTAFRLNPTFLLDHDRRAPLGRVVALGVERLGNHDALTGTAEILAAGTSQRADEAWAEIKAGVRNGISIGFLPVDVDPPGTRGRVLRRVELLEISSVTMPSCRACVVTGTSGAKALADQAALATSVQATLARAEQLQIKLLVADFERICARAERPHGYVFLSKGARPQIERAVRRFAAWAAENLRISTPETKLFREANADEAADFRMPDRIIGVNFSSLDTIAVHADLGPEALSETVAHEVAHVAGADEAAADEFAKKFLANTYRQKTGGGGPRAGYPVPGWTQDRDQTVIVTAQTF